MLEFGLDIAQFQRSTDLDSHIKAGSLEPTKGRSVDKLNTKRQFRIVHRTEIANGTDLTGGKQEGLVIKRATWNASANLRHAHRIIALVFLNAYLHTKPSTPVIDQLERSGMHTIEACSTAHYRGMQHGSLSRHAARLTIEACSRLKPAKIVD